LLSETIRLTGPTENFQRERPVLFDESELLSKTGSMEATRRAKETTTRSRAEVEKELVSAVALMQKEKREKEDEKKEFERHRTMDKILRKMRHAGIGLRIGDRKQRLRTVKNCFMGDEFICWVEESISSRELSLILGKTLSEAVSAEDAQALGSHMLNVGLIYGVGDENDESGAFSKEHIPYRFFEDDESNILNFKKVFDGSSRPPHEVAEDLLLRVIALVSRVSPPETFALTPAESQFITTIAPLDKLSWEQQYREFTHATAELQAVDLSDLKRDCQKLAFWINIFHTMIIHAYLEKGIDHSRARRRNFFTNYCYIIGDILFSIDDIEHGVLRGNRPSRMGGRPFENGNCRIEHMVDELDPRVHFALCYAMEGEPSIRLYHAEIIEEQLNIAGAMYCEKFVEVRMMKRVIVLPHRIEWYSFDIGDTWAEILTFLCYFLEDSFRKIVMELLHKFWDANQVKLRFLKFTWTPAIGRALQAIRKTGSGSLSSIIAVGQAENHVQLRKEGWLAREDRSGKSWRRRYFVLNGATLSYYDSDKKYEGSLRGALTLSGTTTSKGL